MPSGDARRVVIWRLGDALLAATLEAVVEVVAIGGDGRARSRAGELALTVPAGAMPTGDPTRAVILRTPGGRVAVPADEVEGVREVGAGTVREPPRWLDAIDTDALLGLLDLDDGRVAALLDPATLTPAP